MNRLHLLGAVVALALGLGAAVAGWATEGRGFAPEGALTIPTEDGVLLARAQAYAEARAEAGRLSIPASQVVDRLLAGLPTTVLDVRSPEEYGRLHLKGSRLLPLPDLLALGGRVDLPTEGVLVTVCERGLTSTEAMVFLRLAGLPAFAMDGGIGDLRRDLLDPAGPPEGSPFAAPRFEERLAELAALLEGGGAGEYVPPAAPKKRKRKRGAGLGEGC